MPNLTCCLSLVSSGFFTGQQQLCALAFTVSLSGITRLASEFFSSLVWPKPVSTLLTYSKGVPVHHIPPPV